jgi:hypothetical protein
MQDFIGSALYYAKPALRVSPYFHVLAIFKSLKLKLPSTLIKQELQQVIILKHNNSIVTINHVIKLST